VIKLWVDRIGDRYDPAMLDSLSSPEVDRADRMRSDAARVRYVVAHHWLHARLGALLDVALADVPLRIGGSGALALNGDTRSVSFSHHHAHVALAVSDAAIGVDILELPDDTRWVGDTSLVLSSSEVALVRSSPLARRPTVFAHCWTRKEAFGKMRGTGLTADLATLTLTPQAPSQLDGSVRSYELIDAVVALATAAPDASSLVTQRTSCSLTSHNRAAAASSSAAALGVAGADFAQ
jgi:4'-phosphopantetheinyl transferase